MQSFGAHHALHYTVQALCARGKRAVVSLTLSGCVLLSQGGPGVRLAWHRRERQELRRQRCTARRIGGYDNHCDENDAQHDRALHGRRGRDVRSARAIKKTQAKPASLIPLEPTTRNLLAGFLAQPRPSGRYVVKILPRYGDQHHPILSGDSVVAVFDRQNVLEI
jgi:hypothetical protein